MLTLHQIDSEYEDDLITADKNRSKQVVGQLKRKQNHPILPRGVEHRSITDLSKALTKAGYDPSKIEQRAILLAKAAGMKRKRDEEGDDQMDEDSWEDESDGGDGMEVDEENQSPKRVKTESGSVKKKGRVTMVDRTAKTNRALAGLGGPEVRGRLV